MCGSCFTNTDSLLLSAAGAGTAAVAVARRAKDVVSGRTASERRSAAYAANAGFLRSLGHDPALVLGPPPETPTAGSPREPASPQGALLGT